MATVKIDLMKAKSALFGPAVEVIEEIEKAAAAMERHNVTTPELKSILGLTKGFLGSANAIRSFDEGTELNGGRATDDDADVISREIGTA